MSSCEPAASFLKSVPHDLDAVIRNITFWLRSIMASLEVGVQTITSKIVILPIRTKYWSRYAARIFLHVVRKAAIKISQHRVYDVVILIAGRVQTCDG